MRSELHQANLGGRAKSGEPFLNSFADKIAERQGAGTIIINQNNNLNTDSFESLQRAAQALFPALQAEGVRRG